MKALVTGASGFLGGHLVEGCVAAGDKVRALVRQSSDLRHLRTLPEVELATAELSDVDGLIEATRGVDVIYHSAARVACHGSRAQFWAENVLGTQLLLDAARHNGVSRFVFVSSPSALMDTRAGDLIDVDEIQPYPQRYYNLYSETKAAAEQRVLAANSSTLVTCALRPRAIWGPRDRRGFMPRLIGRMRAGRLPDLSGGRTTFTSMCHCDNAVHACLLAARSDRVGGKAYFVTDAERTDVWGLLRRLAEMFGGRSPSRSIPPGALEVLAGAVELVWRIPLLANNYPPPLSRYELTLLTKTSTYAIDAAERDFGYRPQVDRETGLTQLVEWIERVGGIEAYVGGTW